MKLADFTSEPSGVDAGTLHRRVVIISASSLAALFAFFTVAWALTVVKKEEFLWVSAVAFVGFLPGLYGWATGWVSRWKAAVFGFLLPVGIWGLLCLAIALFVEAARLFDS